MVCLEASWDSTVSDQRGGRSMGRSRRGNVGPGCSWQLVGRQQLGKVGRALDSRYLAGSVV